MTRFILIRHGESIANQKELFYGQVNGTLTDRGRAQAARAAEYLRDTHIDAAYASDLIRAYETAAIAALPHGMTPIPDPELREIMAGEWEGVRFDELLPREDYQLWINDIGNAHPTGGESVRELAARVRAEIHRLAACHPGQTVLVVSHATPIRSLICGWIGLPDAAMKDVGWVPNASVTVADYDVDTRSAKLVTVGENSFLGDLATAFGKKV